MSTGTVVNTPGYFYAIAYCFAMYVLLRVMTGKKNSIRQGFIDLLAFILIVGFMVLTADIPDVWFLPAMTVVLLMIFGYIWISYDMTWQEVIFYGIKCFICGEMASSLAWQVYYLGFSSDDVGWQFLIQMAVLLPMLAIVYTFLGFLERHLKQDDFMLQVNTRDALVAVLLLVAVFTTSNLSYVTSNSLFSAQVGQDVFIVRTLVDMVGVAIYYAYMFQTQDLQRRMEVLALQNIMDAQYKNYEMSKESIDMVNQKYHDLKHQITLLKAGAGDRSVRELEQMEQEIRGYEAQDQTGNAVLDTVLMSKSLTCQSKGIELRSVVDGAALSFMDDMDLSALFGNMLDNAIECEERIPQQEKRLIRLNVVREKQFVRILLENYCEEEIQFRDGLPQTTKEDKNMHGFGMKSMQDTVRRYGGSMVTSLKDNWFAVKILLPMPAEEGEV